MPQSPLPWRCRIIAAQARRQQLTPLLRHFPAARIGICFTMAGMALPMGRQALARPGKIVPVQHHDPSCRNRTRLPPKPGYFPSGIVRIGFAGALRIARKHSLRAVMSRTKA
ncbi:hypothetical protein FHW94_000757 [Novosphingobium sp. SG720]|nr:hypothetical protein [Novosphingobium sp. SG720]